MFTVVARSASAKGVVLATLAGAMLLVSSAMAQTKKALTTAEVLEASTPGDWRPLDPANTLYLDLAAGRVVIELAPAFAPNHVANIKALVDNRYFDGLSINRVQDNYVVQWGDAEEKRSLGTAKPKLAPEWDRSATGLPFISVPGPDGYAPETGFSDGWPVARDPKSGRAWLTHCYAMVGAGRGDTADSGNGAELYAVIGHAPRNLDRNVTLVGRVVQGIELLSSMPRGTGGLGFYEQAASRIPIRSVRLAADLPAAERIDLETLRTDTPTFAAYVESRRNRREAWYTTPVGHADVCAIRVPVRLRPVGR